MQNQNNRKITFNTQLKTALSVKRHQPIKFVKEVADSGNSPAKKQYHQQSVLTAGLKQQQKKTRFAPKLSLKF